MGLGNKEEAIAWLEKAYEEREVRLTFPKSIRSGTHFAPTRASFPFSNELPSSKCTPDLLGSEIAYKQ
jgi:hypothetical protein